MLHKHAMTNTGLKLLSLIAGVFAAVSSLLHAQDSERLVYKQAGERSLHLAIEKPANWKPGANLPAIVFFFGGGWVSVSPKQLKRKANISPREA